MYGAQSIWLQMIVTCTPRSIPSVSWIACAIIKAHGIITVSIGSAVVGVV